MTSLVAWFAELVDAPRSLIGGKAASLVSMQAAGVTVPPGFVVTTEAYRRRAAAESAEVEAAIRAAYRRLREQGAELVAVRSSATAEDNAAASFAGLFATVLGVADEDAAVAAVEECWRSADAPATEGYRQQMRDDAELAMAVVVQALVPADCAGVLFTVHPVTEDLDRAVVTGAYGLGELVVSGRVTPDTWVLERSSGRVVEEQLGDKSNALRQVGTRIEEQDVPDADRARPCLSSAQLAELVPAGLRLERHFASPQDVEWAYAAGQLYILQSRPITTVKEAFYTAALYEWLPAARRAELDDQAWDRGSPMSALPVSPLFFTDMARFFAHHYDNMARIRGSQRPSESPFLFSAGWSYFNRKTRDWFVGLTPVDWHGPATRGWVRAQLRRPVELGLMTAARGYYRARDEQWIPEIQARRPDFDTADLDELLHFVEFIDEQRLRGSLVSGNAIEHAKVWLVVVRHLLVRWAGVADPTDDLAGLTSGLPGGETHAETLQLWQLSELVRSPAEQAAIDSFELASLRAAGSPFVAEFDRVQRALAHRGSSDRDFRHPRFGDSEELLLFQLQSFLHARGQDDPATIHARSAGHRAEVEAQLQVRLRSRGRLGPARARLFAQAVAQLQIGWIFRDNQRHLFDHFLWNLRCAYLAAGQRLTDRGVLSEAADVFFCTREELFAAAAHQLPMEELANRAEHRKAMWPKYLADPPPLQRGSAVAAGESAPGEDGDQRGDQLKGLGGSRGIATGPVRVIESMSRLREIQQGDVLVTQSIDPAWSAVFAMLSGIVTEESGMLSHATVLAREYGVPAVIGLAHATSVLRTGEIVTVNGGTGLVVRETTSTGDRDGRSESVVA